MPQYSGLRRFQLLLFHPIRNFKRFDSLEVVRIICYQLQFTYNCNASNQCVCMTNFSSIFS